jgi:CrcB protein
MYAYLLVALGGAIGSVSRFGLSTLIARRWDDSFPWGTIIVNASGSLLIGLLAALASVNTKLTPDARQFLVHFLIIGICGGYTTFSSFSLQTLTLLQSRHYLAAGGNVLLSVTLCLVAVAVGHWLGTLLVPANAP